MIKQTILDAQKNISKTNKVDNQDLIDTKDAEQIKETKKEKVETKKIKIKTKKENLKTVKKISKSILSKVKSLTSKKTK